MKDNQARNDCDEEKRRDKEEVAVMEEAAVALVAVEAVGGRSEQNNELVDAWCAPRDERRWWETAVNVSDGSAIEGAN